MFQLKLAPVLRLVIAIAVMSSIPVTSTQAGDQSQPPEVGKKSPPSLTGKKAIEWAPGVRLPAVDEEAGYVVFFNVFFSRVDAQGMPIETYEEVATLAWKTSKEWDLLSSTRPITRSEEDMLCFVQTCGGANNFPAACTGDVFVKVKRKKSDGTWETDPTFNHCAPYVRLKGSMTDTEKRDRLEGFIKAVFPHNPKVVAVAAAERQKSPARVVSVDLHNVPSK